MRKLPLAELQRQFKETIKKASVDVDDLLRPVPNREARLGVYRYAYFARILESLREDFPRVHEFIGDDKFTTIVREYVDHHPSRFWTLAEYSADFPKFMDNYVDRPFLHDLAQFEWFKIKCSLGPTALQFDPHELAVASEEEWFGARLRLVATLKIFSSHWPVNDSEELRRQSSLPGGEVYYYALYRSTRGFKTLELSAAEVELLEEAAQGKSFGELVQLFARRQVELEEVSAIVARWVSEGLIEKVLFSERKIS